MPDMPPGDVLDNHVLPGLRAGGSMKCWNCEESSRHSDGAVFCGLYAARREEHEGPLQNCLHAKPRKMGDAMPQLKNKGPVVGGVRE